MRPNKLRELLRAREVSVGLAGQWEDLASC
jgi:hypothetical protein